MARSLDQQQQAELSAFVNAIAEAAGYTTSAEWARDSGYAYPNLTKVRAGTGAIDGYNLLRLIRAAAARADVTTEQLALGMARATTEDASELSFARRLDELAGLVTEALTLLRDRTEGRPRKTAAPRSRAK